MSVMIFVLLFMAVVIVVLLISINTKLSDSKRFDRLEQGLLNNRHELIVNKTHASSLAKNYDRMLKELIETKESLSAGNTKLTALEKNMHDMNTVMINTKKRGSFGEYQLYYLLSLYFGESSQCFEEQYHLSNGKIGDAALHIPGSDLVMIIDSKFPSENYLKMADHPDDEHAKTEFRRDIKKHIRDIASKYMIANETTEQAIMFIPSEAIYLYICESESQLMEEAARVHVMMTSPTTLMGVAMTLLNITKDFNRSQHLETIEKMIIALKDDCERMDERYEKTRRSAETLIKQMEEMHISMNKIDQRIHAIYEGTDD